MINTEQTYPAKVKVINHDGFSLWKSSELYDSELICLGIETDEYGTWAIIKNGWDRILHVDPERIQFI
jgi:hypothetical protein